MSLEAITLLSFLHTETRFLSPLGMEPTKTDCMGNATPLPSTPRLNETCSIPTVMAQRCGGLKKDPCDGAQTDLSEHNLSPE